MAAVGLKLVGSGRMLRNITRMSKTVRDATDAELLLMAREVKEESIDRAPIDTGALERSHKIDRDRIGGLTRYTVSFGPIINESGQDYTLLMHEGLGDGEPYELGKRSEAKNSGKPHYGEGVGMKFMTRAAEKVYRRALARLKDSAFGAMNREWNR